VTKSQENDLFIAMAALEEMPFKLRLGIYDIRGVVHHVLKGRHPFDIESFDNSTCAVFAESEIVSLMARGVAKERIIQGLHEAIARRIAALAGSRDMEDDFDLDGGTAKNPGLVAAIEDELFRDVLVRPHPQVTVAYGAARALGNELSSMVFMPPFWLSSIRN
jgi:activator of 2-hydroxyglutaryl-CoA dehydratase